MTRTFTLLSLGDSYTIAESLPIFQSFPVQTVHLLRKQGYEFHAPEIIAKTGWTTDELVGGIVQCTLLKEYDFVTLLIGVNNQYRERAVEEYGREFKGLLQRAIKFARDDASHVIVLSIPDWGATPFAAGRDLESIATGIDEYNDINRQIAAQYGAQYLDITPGTRDARTDETLIAADKLHPSGKAYAKWSQELARMISSKL